MWGKKEKGGNLKEKWKGLGQYIYMQRAENKGCVSKYRVMSFV
jgi:hypothetical protein